MKHDMTYMMKAKGHRYTDAAQPQPRRNRHGRPLLRAAALVALLLTSVGMEAQTNYVFYNGTYGYLYNDNGTLKSSTSLQFDKSSVWVASGEIGGTSRTIQSFTSGQYLGNAGALSNTSSNWRGNNNYLCYRTGNTNYYLKATSATTFTTNSNQNNGNRYNYYTVTINDIVQGFSEFEITGGEDSFNATGSSTYGHTNADYCNQPYTHYTFNGNNYYVNASNVSTGTNPATTVTDAANYTWSLSDNADGYATVDNNGVVTVIAIPASGKLTVTLTCTVTYNSQTATATKSITLTQTGVSGTTVTLDDREDHNWSYYQASGNLPTGYPSELHSPDPRNVKITYKGNGQYTNGTTVSGVKVGVDADANTFVYYKTLEKGTDGKYAYTTIPNPFSVRPKSGNTYYGFSHWKVTSISGGAIDGTPTTINAETEIKFIPSGTYTTNCTSIEVVLEAVWDVAEVSTDGNFTNNYGVERMFYVVSTSTNTNLPNANRACTYSSFYPNGTTNGTNAATLNNRATRRSSFTAAADSKIEYIILYNYNDYSITGAGYNLTIGRGVSSYNNNGCASYIYGRNSNAGALDYTLRIESGTYTNFYLTGAGRTFSSTLSAKCVLGSDYDRAANNNTNLSIADGSGNIYGGTTLTFSSSSNRNNLTFDWLVKSGTYHNNILGNASSGDKSIYLGSSQANNGNLQYIGKRRITVEGGNIASIAGAMNNQSTSYSVNDGGWAVMVRVKGGTIRGSIYGAAGFAWAVGDRTMIFTGGTINGWVAGGCNGTQTGSGGTLDGDTRLYVGGNIKIVHTNADPTISTSKGGNVFGAGSGYSADYEIGEVNNSTLVLADNAEVSRGVYGGGNFGYVGSGHETNIYVLGGKAANVFGGANQRFGQTVNITMTGGLITDGLYGGSNVSGTINNNVTMNINGGQVGTDSKTANIHGGGYGANTIVTQNVEITLGATTQTTPGVTVYGDVYGGSALGYVNGTAATNTYHTYVTLNKGTINGSLYGGGLGDGSNAANVYGPVAVKVYGGTVNTTSANGSGAVYGCNNINGAPQRAVTVDIYGTDPAPSADTYALDAVYGGGNQADYSYGTPTVKVHNCDNSIAYVYGGGNAAHITNGNTDVTIYGGDKIGNVFGGGNGTVTAANVSGNTNVKIYGGTILKVFGGSNSQGTIGGTINVTAESQPETAGDTPCPMLVDELYGGGNMAPSNVGNITIGCMNGGDMINYVYGGSNDADITGAITLTMTGGRVEHLFGGNNTGHSISGDIEVNVDWGTTCPDSYLGYVYGAGNKADFGHNTTVNIKNGTVTHDVFGGGLEAEVAGDVAVNVTGGAVLGDLYGGGALANTNTGSNKTTTVNLVGGSVNNVYGGGLGQKSGFYGATSDIPAYVNGNVLVELNGSTESGASNNCVVTGNIFGCNNLNGTPKGTVTVHVHKTKGNGTTKVRTASDKLDSPTESDHTYELAAVYGGGNMAAYEPTDLTNGKTVVIIDGCDETSIGYVYGGGNAASVPATEVTINGTYEIGNVFGGGNGKDALPNGDPNPGANVGYYADGTTAYGTGVATVNAYGGLMHSVFGGSNTLGDVRQTSVAYIDELSTCPLQVDEIYGGGNEAYMSGNLQVKLGCITYMKELYGGAKAAPVGGDIVLTITSGHFDRIFGGNNISGNIGGSITINIEETGCHPVTIGELYGCGNNAAYTTPAGKSQPTINIKSFTSIGRVFGGGLGTGAVVTGNPTIHINEVIGERASYSPWTYPGSTITYSDGSTVTLPAHTAGEMGSIGTVFGGGNAADVVGDTYVNVATASTVDYVSVVEGESTARTGIAVVGANIAGNVYGGGNEADVTGKTNVTIGPETTTTP